MAVSTFTKTGNKATTPAKLDKAVFGVDVKNHELLKQAYVAYLSNARESSAVTKTRGLVSGGGRKPWKQKGTGRARFGSSVVVLFLAQLVKKTTPRSSQLKPSVWLSARH
jgi:ribosomal protein L4